MRRQSLPPTPGAAAAAATAPHLMAKMLWWSSAFGSCQPLLLVDQGVSNRSAHSTGCGVAGGARGRISRIEILRRARNGLGRGIGGYDTGRDRGAGRNLRASDVGLASGRGVI